MRLIMCLLALLYCSIIDIEQAVAQNQSPEFIESFSPLPGGGRVTSRSTSAGGLQTVTQDSQSTSRDLNNRLSSVLDRNASQPRQRESVFRQSSTSNSAVINQTNLNQRYSYPAPASKPLGLRVAHSPTRLAYPPVRATRSCTDCQVPFQLPTLGLSNTTNTTRTARQVYGQGNCCSPQTYSPNTALAVPAYQAPVLKIQPPASQTPTLAIQDSKQVPQFNNGTFQTAPIAPAVVGGTPQFGAQAKSWWNPIVTGSGAYQPMIRLANVPPGTYRGQGIIGQPKAYVDGQPVRNLLRYVFP